MGPGPCSAGVEAVTETARGGDLLKGIGLTRNDVSVVTNVSADHLGLQGIDTLDQLAEVKAVVPRITRRRGGAAQRRRDPRVFAMRSVIKARPWMSRDPNSPAIRETLDERGRATTVIDGWVSVLRPGADPDPLVELVEATASRGCHGSTSRTRWSWPPGLPHLPWWRVSGPSAPTPSTTPAG